MKTEIKPTYVTFDQAKKLKEKGCDVRTNDDYLERQQQWQVIEWFRLNHRIWILISNCNIDSEHKWCFDIHKLHSGVIYLWNKKEPTFDSPQEATSAAIDYVLEKLI